MRYSLVFIFNQSLSHVFLIEKQKPEWMRGKLNGIGGKFNEPERPVDCATREIFEESNLIIQDPRTVSVMSGEDFKVFVFAAAVSEEKIDKELKNKEEEKIRSIPIKDLYQYYHLGKLMPNVLFLIPHAITKLNENNIDPMDRGVNIHLLNK